MKEKSLLIISRFKTLVVFLILVTSLDSYAGLPFFDSQSPGPDSGHKPKTSRFVQATHPEIVELAQDLTKDSETDIEKVRAINAWMAQNITYNYSKSSAAQSNDAVTTLDMRTGICMGYANLFAALARAAGLETKVITGKAVTNGQKYYHQWNEVKADGTWYFIDTTWNAGLREHEKYIMPKSNYPADHYGYSEVKSL